MILRGEPKIECACWYLKGRDVTPWVWGRDRADA
jgi:hypothetical protein